jgi:hypothetical protein
MSIVIKKKTSEYFALVSHASSVIESVLPSGKKVSYNAAEMVVIGVHQSLQEVLGDNPEATTDLAITRLLGAEQAMRALYTVYTGGKSFSVCLKGWATVVHNVETEENAIVIAQLEAIINNRSYDFIGATDVSCKAGA